MTTEEIYRAPSAKLNPAPPKRAGVIRNILFALWAACVMLVFITLASVGSGLFSFAAYAFAFIVALKIGNIVELVLRRK